MKSHRKYSNNTLPSLTFERHLEFINKTDKKNFYGDVNKLVKLALSAQEKDLELKRNRLRTLLGREDEIYEKELLNQIQTKVEKDIEEREKKLFNLKKISERQNEKLFEEKRIQQFMNNNDDIRMFLRKKLLEDSKACQLMQIDEKRKIDHFRKECDNVWLEIAQRKYQMEREQQRAEERLKELKNKEIAQILQQQINEHEVEKQRESKYFVEEKIQNSKVIETEEEIEKKKQKIEKCKALVAELDKQMRESQYWKQKQEADDAFWSKKMIGSIKSDMEKQKEIEKSKKEAFRRQTFEFLEYNQQIRKQNEAERKQQEMLLKKEIEKLNEKMLREKRELKALQESTKARNNWELRKQIAEQEQQRFEANKNKLKYQSELGQQIFLKEQEEKSALYKKRQDAMEYRMMLQKQIDSNKLKMEQITQQQEAEIGRIAKYNAMQETLAKQFMNEKCNWLPPHPHIKILCNQQKHQS